jgi:hypothetical protein
MALTKEGKGAVVVDDVISQIENSGILPSDKGFLRRVAWVESKFGTDPGTYRV